MTRAKLIHHMRVAGYHGDMVALSILHAGSTIPKKEATKAFKDGQKLRANGVRCGCNICAPKASK